MKIDSVKAHLRPYSIYKKRRTTINHTFASAIASRMVYNRDVIAQAIRTLEQDPDLDLTCVYCGKEAETWDHVFALVKDNEFSGFGHEIGNLVPCCKQCNQKKGNKPWEVYLALPNIAALPGSERRKGILKNYLEVHASSLRKKATSLSPDKLQELKLIKEKILSLLKQADEVIQ